MYIMPTLPLSMAQGIKKSPMFNTVKQKTAAGITSAVALQPYPTWAFTVDLDHVTGSEVTASSVVAKFLGTYMATCGGANLFLFSDPQDNSITLGQFGTGDGTSTKFQLSRNINGQVDIIQNLNGTPSIYVNGVLTTPASISATGVVTFSSAPANAALLKWTGSFYFACRFDDDTVDGTREFSINNGVDHWTWAGIKFHSEFIPTTTYGNIAAAGGV